MNLLAEYGYSQKEIDTRIKKAWASIFESKSQRFYFEDSNGTGFIEDTGNFDVRTEGMSYGMMMAVQMDKKDVFDRLWKWSKKYMYIDSGENKGYFRWSCHTDGTSNSNGPAPDGEEYYAMALFFASHRWGDGEGIFNYSKEASAILRTAVHGKHPMWNNENYLIRFVPDSPFSDPSYHLPHFYSLFALWADRADYEFWMEAANASRKYIAESCHPDTGLAPEYARNDGTPMKIKNHGTFFSDAYRVAANIGLDAIWSGETPELTDKALKILKFFDNKRQYELYEYHIDGRPFRRKARHPVGLIATLAQAVLSPGRTKRDLTDEEKAMMKRAVVRFMETPLRKGKRRYYDNCLYFFALLALSGNYKVY